MSGSSENPEAPAGLLRALVGRLGGRASARLGLDVAGGGDAARGRWLVASCLIAGLRDEDRAVRTFRALDAAGLSDPAGLAAAQPERVAEVIFRADSPKPEMHALKLVRASHALRDRFGGSLDALAADADGLEDLGGRVARLAPGLGAASVTLFLRELRDCWPAAADVPLSPATIAAAVHLGLLRQGIDPEAASGVLERALAGLPDAPPAADVEAALHRLGARSCLRGRLRRCPLGDTCPARGAAGGA